jgi:hypothetical protein
MDLINAATGAETAHPSGVPGTDEPERVFGVWRWTMLRWLRYLLEQLPTLTETVLPAQADDVLEIDETRSFVSKEFFKRWLWTAMCRRTRQMGAYAIGDRSETTARHLGKALPDAYRACPIYTDAFNVYPRFIPSSTTKGLRAD